MQTVPSLLPRRVRVSLQFPTQTAGAAQAFASQSSRPPHRWLPVPVATREPSASPRTGWMKVEDWKDRLDEVEPGSVAAPPITGCSALVRTVRKALVAPADGRPLLPSFWRRVAMHGGRAAKYLRPDEFSELLEAFADARLQWEGDPNARKGLERFARHAAAEIGSFPPPVLGKAVWSLARLDFHHEELMQSLSRAVEQTVQFNRTRLDNASVCTLLAAYRRLGVLDEPVMNSLSRLVCRRLVREPLEPSETAKVVVAYAELRMRDLGLFNATTLALTRPGHVNALKWGEMADVAYSYASLRLHSADLFGKIWKRVAESAGVQEELLAQNSQGSHGEVAEIEEELREQMRQPLPELPRLRLPVRAVARLLETQVHLDRLGRGDLAPLLPHLAHPVDRVSARPALVLAAALSRGGHVQPWLWRWTSAAFADDSLPPRLLLSLLEALRAHLARLEPLLASELAGRRFRRKWKMSQTAPDAGQADWTPVLRQHLTGAAGNLMNLMGVVSYRCTAMSDAELQVAVTLVPKIVELHGLLVRILSLGSNGFDNGLTARVQKSLARTSRRLAAEMARRSLGGSEATRDAQTNTKMSMLADLSGASVHEVEEDASHLKFDSIHYATIEPFAGDASVEATLTHAM